MLTVVHGHLAAFNAADPDAVAATFAEDAVFASGTELVVGRRALHAWFADAFAVPVEDWSLFLEVRRALVDGDTAACELAETIRVGTDERVFDLAGFYTVRDGLLVRVKVYREGTSAAE